MGNIIPFRPRSEQRAPNTDATVAAAAGASELIRRDQNDRDIIAPDTRRMLHELQSHWFMVVRSKDDPKDAATMTRVVRSLHDAVTSLAKDRGGPRGMQDLLGGVEILLGAKKLTWRSREQTRRLCELSVPTDVTANQIETIIRLHLPQH